MIIIWIVYFALLWGFSSILNRKIFNEHPASTSTTWTLTIVIFIVSFIALSIARMLMLVSVMGQPSATLNPTDMSSAFISSVIFYGLLNKRRDKVADTKPTTPNVRNISSSRKERVGDLSMKKELEPETALLSEDKLYEIAWQEIESNSYNIALWSKVFAQTDGDLNRAKAQYISQRVSNLMQNEEERIRSEEQQIKEAKKHNLPARDIALMSRYGITFDGQTFHFNSNRYWSLSDAISDANRQLRKSNQNQEVV